MESAFDTSTLTDLVDRVMVVEDTTIGDDRQKFLLRFRGRLRMDSEKAYDQLTALLKPHSVMPLFRWDDSRHAVLIIPALPEAKPANTRTNLIMFLLTLVSVLWTGGVTSLETELPSDPLRAIGMLIEAGWPFAVSMLAILGAHELGHYFAGRKHGVNVTLPYFLPLPYPLSPFGTLGAFINMKEPPRNRKQLLDIGVAGPFSGLVVAIVVVLIGLSLSTVKTIEPLPGGNMMEGNSILYLGLKYLTFGRLLPEPATYDATSPLLYWIGYFFTGQPAPVGGLDVMIHPVAWAGWAGLLVTALNLIPAGQLDGGHLLYVLFGQRKARQVFPFILGALVLLGFVWEGWWLWALLIFMFGRVYAEPLDQITQLDPRRKRVAALALVVFVLVFIPVPLMIF